MEPPGFAPTGAPAAFETAEFWEFEGGLLAQVGAAPSPGGRSERVNVWLQRIAARRPRRRRG